MKRVGLTGKTGMMFALGFFLILSACGGSNSSGSGQGAVGISVMDAPGDFDHAYITVKDVWFHKSDTADPRSGDWLKYPLTAPVTVDLLALSNGEMQSIWSGIQLPAGLYKQIRLFLEPTYPTSANPAPPGHTYFNEVVTGPSTTLPLYVPDAYHGIRLVGAFTVTAGKSLNLAIDFDAGHDVVEFHEGEDYLLKPRLTYFDLDNVGAIIGQISTGGTFTTTPRFVIKAERMATAQEMIDSGATTSYHVIRRWTVPDANGRFILYPVSTLVTNTWDVVLRGLDRKTVIVKGVPIMKGATPASKATDLGIIDMMQASTPDYAVAGSIQSPTGAWVQFYQTLQGAAEAPYEIRFRHFNPLFGAFRQNFELNNDQILVGSYVGNGVLSALTATTPVEGIGGYGAVAGAFLYNRSAAAPVSSSTTTVQFAAPLAVVSSYQSRTVSGAITLHTPGMMMGHMDKGLLFAVNGGMIVNTLNGTNSAIDSQMDHGGSYAITVPGGSASMPLPGALYGIDAVGWSSSGALYKAVAVPQIVDVRTGNDTADIDMLPWWRW